MCFLQSEGMLEQNPNWPIHPEHSVAANGFDLKISKFGNRDPEICFLLPSNICYKCNILFTNLDFLPGIHNMQDTLHFFGGFLEENRQISPHAFIRFLRML